VDGVIDVGGMVGSSFLKVAAPLMKPPPNRKFLSFFFLLDLVKKVVYFCF
jgi:hypothetical protein